MTDPKPETITDPDALRVVAERWERHAAMRAQLIEDMPPDWPDSVQSVLAYDYATSWQEGWPDTPDWHRRILHGNPDQPTVTTYGWEAAGVTHSMRIGSPSGQSYSSGAGNSSS